MWAYNELGGAAGGSGIGSRIAHALARRDRLAAQRDRARDPDGLGLDGDAPVVAFSMSMVGTFLSVRGYDHVHSFASIPGGALSSDAARPLYRRCARPVRLPDRNRPPGRDFDMSAAKGAVANNRCFPRFWARSDRTLYPLESKR